MLELMAHCHYLVAVEDASLGFPEVTLPVVPGMEGCHWPFRKAPREEWPKLVALLLSGAPVKAKNAVGWLVDAAAPLDAAIGTAWDLASGPAGGVKRRVVEKGALSSVPRDVAGLPPVEGATVAAREAIMLCIQKSCAAILTDALAVQAKISGDFMTSKECRAGRVGQEYARTMEV
jgi:enoyl-CoA hydratase/carnithine racemase